VKLNRCGRGLPDLAGERVVFGRRRTLRNSGCPARRLLAEQAIGLADARFVLALVERLPQGAETLRPFARRR